MSFWPLLPRPVLHSCSEEMIIMIIHAPGPSLKTISGT
jgi:hypothetical protein